MTMPIEEFLAAQTPAAVTLPRRSPDLRPGNLAQRVYYQILDKNCFESFEFEGPFRFDDIATSSNVLSDSSPVTGSSDTKLGDVTILGVIEATVALPPDIEANWTISDIRHIATIAPSKELVREQFHEFMDTDGVHDLIWKYVVTDVFYAAEFSLTFKDEPLEYSLDIKSLERDGVVRLPEAASAPGVRFRYDDQTEVLTVENNLSLPFAVGGYYLSSDF